MFNPGYTETLRQVSELISDKPMMHRCHTIERHDVYECLILNVALKEELELLEQYIVL